MKQKARQANIELLRIVAMLMVVMLHYLTKGEATVSMVENLGPLNMILWFIKALCVVAVNVYVLISGYFLLEAKWKVSRLVSLWLQMMFYSLGVPLVCFVLGVGEIKQWGLYDWINVVFPIQMEHYWFITAYFVLYILVPVLSAGVKQLNQKQHGWIIAGLLLVISVPKSVLPIGIPTDRYGYDFGWFICLFLIAAYLRMYGIPVFNRKRTAFAIYLAAVLGIWGISLVCAVLTRKGLSFTHMMNMTYSYNYLLVVIAAVALFYVFKYIEIPQGKVSYLICRISSYNLGVYLLHENMAIRTKWQFLLGIENVKGGVEIFPHMIFSVIAVFIAGVLVDYVRDCFFKSMAGIWKKCFAGKIAEHK